MTHVIPMLLGTVWFSPHTTPFLTFLNFGTHVYGGNHADETRRTESESGFCLSQNGLHLRSRDAFAIAVIHVLRII